MRFLASVPNFRQIAKLPVDKKHYTTQQPTPEAQYHELPAKCDFVFNII